MAFDGEEVCDRDNRTLFVGGLSDKMNEKILYELFFQAGPIERVSIPLEKDGKIRPFGFVTYKYFSSVNYALNIFAGTILFGRELSLKNRNPSKNRDRYQQHSQPSLMHGFNHMANYGIPGELSPSVLQTHQLLQQQLIAIATGSNSQGIHIGPQQMFEVPPSDETKHERFVDRNRFHRGNRKPYYRSRSRSPPYSYRSRNKSPVRKDHSNKERNRHESTNYHRWGKN